MMSSEDRVTVTAEARPLSISSFDAWWSRARITGTPSEKSPLLINLELVTYAHLEAMVFLLALIVDRDKRNLETKVDLPRSTTALDFFRAADFANAIQAATGKSLDTFLTVGSQIRFQDRTASDSNYGYAVTTPGGKEEKLLAEKYFALTPVAMSDGPDRAGTLAKERYLNDQLVTLLDRQLKKDSRRFGPFLFQEAVINAVSHPKASVAFTAAQIRPKELSLVVWDDGVSFADSLGGAPGRRMRSPAFTAEGNRMKIDFVDRDGELESRQLSFESDDKTKTDEDLIAFAWMLGVSSTPDLVADRGRSAEDLQSWIPAQLAMYSGVGLHLIRRCVIDVFGGEILYATGGYRLELRSGGAQGHYKGLLTLRRELRAQPAGNLLVFKIPINQ